MKGWGCEWEPLSTAWIRLQGERLTAATSLLHQQGGGLRLSERQDYLWDRPTPIRLQLERLYGEKSRVHQLVMRVFTLR